MNTEIIRNTSNDNFDIQQLMNIVGQTSMSVQGVAQQMGIVATKVSNMENDVVYLKDEIEHIKQNEEITTEQVTTITNAAKSRIRQILGEDEFEYAKYSKGFFGRLYTDARNNNGMGSSIAKTRKGNFQNVLNYIEAWNPKGGTRSLKDEIDKKAEANKKAKELGYI